MLRHWNFGNSKGGFRTQRFHARNYGNLGFGSQQRLQSRCISLIRNIVQGQLLAVLKITARVYVSSKTSDVLVNIDYRLDFTQDQDSPHPRYH